MLNTVIFKDYANATLPRKFLSLFPGLGYAAGYKVSVPVYRSKTLYVHKLSDTQVRSRRGYTNMAANHSLEIF